MEQIQLLLEEHWQFLVIACGLVTVVGALCNWRWLTRPEGENPFGLGRFIYDHFGSGGYRVFTGLLGLVLIILGVCFL